MRRSRYLLGALALLLPTSALAQRPDPLAQERPLPALAGRPGPAMQRQRLQQLVFARFMDRASQRLGLNAGERQRLEQVLRENEAQRRSLAREARTVRQELVAASNDPGVPAAEFDRLLGRMDDLRARDLQLWRDEQARLGTVLTSRQRAQFMAMRLEFAEMVQRMRQPRQGRAPGGPQAP
ncbi:MAG TPA: hypothetical protein VF832_13230 [Longimicrobiales bacterium]